MAVRCTRSLGDVDKSRPGLFLFNYFVAEDRDMDELHSMTVRDLIAALADAENATRRARHSADSPNGETLSAGEHAARRLAELRAREDLIVEELRRRSAQTRHSVPADRSPSAYSQAIVA